MGIIEKAVGRSTEAKTPAEHGIADKASGTVSGQNLTDQHFSESVLKEHRVIGSFATDSRAEAYRQLRTQVLQAMDAQGFSGLAVTSPNEGAGKTLTATNLAMSIARDVRHTAILVDLDLRKPSVHKALGIESTNGVIDYLYGEIALDEICVGGLDGSLVVVPGRQVEEYSSELLASERMDALISGFKNKRPSPVLIYDLPPLLRNDDALLLCSKVDATLMVIEDGATNQSELSRSVELLKDANLLGTILNKVRL